MPETTTPLGTPLDAELVFRETHAEETRAAFEEAEEASYAAEELRAEATGDAALAKAVLYGGYELQNAELVGSYFEKHPDELPKWEAFMGAAEEHNALEAMGASVSVRVLAPEEPRELRGAVGGGVGC